MTQGKVCCPTGYLSNCKSLYLTISYISENDKYIMVSNNALVFNDRILFTQMTHCDRFNNVDLVEKSECKWCKLDCMFVLTVSVTPPAIGVCLFVCSSVNLHCLQKHETNNAIKLPTHWICRELSGVRLDSRFDMHFTELQGCFYK